MPVLHTPNIYEQELLELLNRTRLDPVGEFDRLIANVATGQAVQDNITWAMEYFGVDVTALQNQFNNLSSVAPLAWNDNLALSSDRHSEAMIAADEQSHQLAGEESLGQRVNSAGYQNWSRVAENIYAYSYDMLYGHAGFMIDWGYDTEDYNGGQLRSNWQSLGDGIQDPAGHRDTILNGNLVEVGVSVIAEDNSATQVGPNVITQNFGNRFDYTPQLVGVVIADADGDRFYDAGEGLGGITVSAVGDAGTFVTTTWAAGGYQMELPTGTYTVSFSGGALNGVAQYQVTMGSVNTKLDGFAADAQVITGLQLVEGTAADDQLLGTSGINQMLIGAGGNDQLLAGDGNDILLGDGVVFSGTSVSDQIYRLYQATLDRAPDAGGFDSWVRHLLSEAGSLQSAAEGFVSSTEFQQTYGALSNAGFVELLYQNVLERAADISGLTSWVGLLEGGTSRAEVVIGFSESAEFKLRTTAETSSFAITMSEASWCDEVYRLYQATLDRAPDSAGFADWIGQLGGGRDFLTVVEGFVGSAEFQQNYGALNNSAFVELLYQNVLGRAADSGGLASWVGQLDGGTSRAEVVRGFSQSNEFITATTDALEQYMRGLGQDDLLSGGAGENVLMGGAYADVFVFNSATAGSHQVQDLEAWDTLRLDGFGFADAAAARAAFTQSGQDAVFSQNGVHITLTGIDPNTLTDAQFDLI